MDDDGDADVDSDATDFYAELADDLHRKSTSARADKTTGGKRVKRQEKSARVWSDGSSRDGETRKENPKAAMHARENELLAELAAEKRKQQAKDKELKDARNYLGRISAEFSLLQERETSRQSSIPQYRIDTARSVQFEERSRSEISEIMAHNARTTELMNNMLVWMR